MSVNGDAARRDMWAERIERCLASDMAIGEWCSLNKVNKSSLYRWLAVFCDEGPGSSAGKNSETSGWAKAMRDGIAEAREIKALASMVDAKVPLGVGKGRGAEHVSSVACMSAQVRYAAGIDSGMVATGW